MRAIFFVLLLVNLVLFALHWVDTPTQDTSKAAPKLDQASSLSLLSEASESVSGRRAADSSAASVSRPAASADLGTSPLCTLLGPFTDRAAAETTLQRLQALDLDASVRDLEVPDGKGYWVYLEPELSHRAALRRLHELQAKQIDSYIIPRGDLANGISFGMFSREALALARRDEMQDLGYEARIREIERTHREVWISLSPGSAQNLGDSLWDDLLEQFPGLERRQNFCPGVASE